MFDLFFPTYCINCGQVGEYLCSTCIKKLKNTLPECYICRRISQGYTTHKQCDRYGLESVFVGWEYGDVSKKILLQYKYKYAYKLSEILSSLLIDRLKSTGFAKKINSETSFIPIPIHKNHENHRGFNQSELIAIYLAQYFGCRIDTESIKRVGDKRYQSQQSLRDRLALEDDVFRVEKDSIIDSSSVILVDDVISTGSTLNRIAKVLDCDNLSAITLFRGKPHYPTPAK